MTVIATKREFYRLWRAGLLGNRPRTFDTARELRRAVAQGFRGTVSARADNVRSWKTRYRLTPDEALALAAQQPGLTFNESAPDEVLLIQGEVHRGVGGLYLRYDTTPNLKMKEAMARAKDAWRLHAQGLLRQRMAPSSYDDVMELLDEYPGHVVEFSTHGVTCGDCPHRNTLIWEVRAY